MRILIACERSGRVREACRAFGHNAWSCDLAPAEDGSAHHYVADVRDALHLAWDALIAFPDCRYLAVSGMHWNARRPGRSDKTRAALAFVRELLDAPIPRIALENPIGVISTRIRPASQIVQPYDFGDDASKATCLWLKGLPLLVPTTRVRGRIVTWRGKRVERWANQTDSGQNKLPPSTSRAMDRARTYPGIASAMAAQWFGPDARQALPLFDEATTCR